MARTAYSSKLQWLLVLGIVSASIRIVGCVGEGRNEQSQRTINQYFESLVEEDSTLVLNAQDERAATILALQLKVRGPRHPRRFQMQPTADDVERALGVTPNDDPELHDSKLWKAVNGDRVVTLTAKWNEGKLVLLKHRVWSNGGMRNVTETVGLSSGDWKYTCETPLNGEFSAFQSTAKAANESVLQSAKALIREDSNPSHELVNELGAPQGGRPWLLASPYPTKDAIETQIGQPDEVDAGGFLVWEERSLETITVPGQPLKFDVHVAGTKEAIVKMSFDESDKGLARMTLYYPNALKSVGRRSPDYEEKFRYRR